jgi:hypothetical protein
MHGLLPYLYENPKTGNVFVRGCRGIGEICNGNYGLLANRDYKGSPLYKNGNGAIIYNSG